MSCAQYADFLDTHQLQLLHSKLPECLWRRLYEVVGKACPRVRFVVLTVTQKTCCARRSSHPKHS